MLTMVLLHDSVEFKKLDVRMIERNIARGVLTQSELDSATSQLPDESESADWVTLDSLNSDSEDSK